MKLIFFVSFLLGCSLFPAAQTGKLTGTVLDAETRLPLELATITIFRADTSLLSYQLSDKNGKFILEKLPLNENLQVSVTYVGYTAFRTNLQLQNEKPHTLAVTLAISLKDTVLITAAIPIRMNGDTLEINPAAFKMDRHAVVEELLNEVPGITIWTDGTITINGKKVQNLLVDGKPFMGSTDTRVATQNLPKAVIEKIQLYQEYDRSQIGRETQPRDSLLTMNIQLKEANKKGYFGKAGVGYGTTERFEGDLTFQVYNKRSSAGFGGGINNINKNIGNLQEMFQNNTFRNFNPNLYNVGRFGITGINRNYSLGSVIAHNFIETTNSRQNNRLTLNYNTSGSNGLLTDLHLQDRTTVNNPQQIKEEGIQNNRTYRHDLGVNYTRTNSYSDNLTVNGSLSQGHDRAELSRSTEVRDSAHGLQSRNQLVTRQNRQSDNLLVTGSFAKSALDDPLKRFHIEVSARRVNNSSDREMRSVFQSLNDITKNASNNRRYYTTNYSTTFNGSIDYFGIKRLLFGRYNLFGINLNFSQWFHLSRTMDENAVSDYDTTSKRYSTNGNISNKNQRDIIEYSPSFVLSKVFTKRGGAYAKNINLQLKLTEDIKDERNKSSVAKRNLNRSFQFFRYEGNGNYSYTKWDKYQASLNFNYTKSFEYPHIDLLYTIVDDINPYEIKIGNPSLKNRINHRSSFSADFTTQNPKSTYSLTSTINAGMTRSKSPVTDSVINDRSGKRITYFVNAGTSSASNLNYNLNISKRLNKNQLQAIYNCQINGGQTPNYVDGRFNVSNTMGVANQLTIQFSLRSVFIINVAQNIQHYSSKQSAAGLTGFKNTNSITKLGVVVNCPANFSFSSTCDRITNSTVDRQTILWNTFAAYRFMKQQAELKFTAMDILKQYQNITNSVNTYGTSTRITNGLQQYFLMTFSYYPRSFGKTEIKRSPNQ